MLGWAYGIQHLPLPPRSNPILPYPILIPTTNDGQTAGPTAMHSIQPLHQQQCSADQWRDCQNGGPQDPPVYCVDWAIIPIAPCELGSIYCNTKCLPHGIFVSCLSSFQLHLSSLHALSLRFSPATTYPMLNPGKLAGDLE